MDWRMERQAPFLKSVLREGQANRRNEVLRLANSDQINAVSELVMNTIKGVVPRSRNTVKVLRPHAQVLRQMANPRNSLKKRRKWMMEQTCGSLWKELGCCYKRCLKCE